MENWLTLVDEPDPKWDRVQTTHPTHVWHPSERTPAQSTILTSRQMDTRNGITLWRLSRSSEQATNRRPSWGGMTQEAKALDNARDTLT
jgi:hypothetical protein